ncbi:hypothetical protein BJ878DRAFT_414213 [Calycina marina]|uniref:TOG domain-containing protein n=1 Tax=Calycina marina TaxID=1763456 RepID=A0A9P7Z9I0_9HELO|nr:hypothetical protein BJ878DRAFT_414213 [Calycina marina]
MCDKITEEQVANLAAIVRTDASVDAKVHQFNTIKSGIKQTNVPDPAVPILFEATRTAMSTPHAALTNAGFSTLNHLLTRMSRQEPKHITKEAPRTLPLVIEKMGDHKDKYRQLATQCLTTFWKNAPIDVERIVKNAGLVGKNSRMKETCVQWIVQMHEEYQMPFKSYVSTLMELLEDADGMVRDVARNSVISLFKNAPNAAKSDLKKKLKIFNVRQTIASAIIAHLGPGGPAEAEPELVEAPRPKLASSMTSVSAARPATPVEVKIEHVEPSYVNTRGELEDIFRDMQPYFEGKESEGNWLKREQNCTKLRRLIAGNVLNDFHDAFLAGVKAMLDGVLKAVNSLRTSLSKEGCSVIQELARDAGPGIDNMVEILLQNLIKLCGGTKKISSQNGNLTVGIIISKVSYNIRIMQHIWAASQDKNVQPRTYATGWLKTLLKKEASHKNHLEHTGGLDLVEKCIKKGLADANQQVRENMRSTYWAFAPTWPAKAEAIFAGLDNTQQRLLENAPDNPGSPRKPDIAAAPRPGLGLSKSTMGPPKPSLRETMLAQKKAAMATKNLPARPGSAMSSFSPMRTVSSSSTASTSSTTSDAPGKTRPESRTVTHKGLSVAPMRPIKFRPRPEISRPATAGPYSVRRPGHAPSSSDTISPSSARSLTARTPSATHSSPPKRNLPLRPNTSHSSHASHSSNNSPAKGTVSKAVPSPNVTGSPRMTPAKSKSMASLHVSSSPSKDEDFTVVVLKLSKLKVMKQEPLTTVHSSDDETHTPAKPMKIYEDPFSSSGDQTTPRPTFSGPVLEEVAINEDAAKLRQNGITLESNTAPDMTPEQYKQSSRLLDSGISKIKAKSLDVHGFRKLQGMIRDNKAGWNNEKFDMLLMGLFAYLEAPLPLFTQDKAKDVKSQVLGTINMMYKKDRDAFHGYAPTGLSSIIAARSFFDSRDHIVSAMEKLADILVTLADPKETSNNIVKSLHSTTSTVEGCRTLSMGLYVLKQLIEAKSKYIPSDGEASGIGKLAAKCLDSSDSGVRMDAVQLCVSLDARIGEASFWGALEGLKDTSRNLITYYIAKHQNESRETLVA